MLLALPTLQQQLRQVVLAQPQEKQVQQAERLPEKQLQVELLQLVALVLARPLADVRPEASVRVRVRVRVLVLAPVVALQPSSLTHKLLLASNRTVSLLQLEAHQTSKIQTSVAHSLLVHQYSVLRRVLEVLEVLEEDLAVAQEQAVLEPADSVAVAHEVLLLLQLQLHNFAPLIRGAMIH